MRIIFIIFILFGFGFNCFSDVVTTADGDSYEGVITEVSIRTPDGDVLTFSGEDISSIEISGGEGYEEEMPEEEMIEKSEEKEVEEPQVVEEAPVESEQVEEEKEQEEHLSPEKKPLIIGPQIKGLDEDRYKTY